jgi:hypothetical protein
MSKMFSYASFLFLTFLFIVCVISGCRNDGIEKQTEEFQIQSANAGYRPDKPILANADLRVLVKTRTDLEKGELVVTLNVKNYSARSIEVDYLNCVLNIDDERVAVPKVLTQYRSSIPYDEEETYEIYFTPINSVDHYTTAEYRGDMKQQYKVEMNFITDWRGERLINEHVVLSLSDSTFQDYLSKEAREDSMKLMEFDFDNQAFNLDEARHLKKVLYKNLKINDSEYAASIFSISPSISINRMIFNLYSYREGDTLVLNMRMLNEDSYPLKIIPSKCLVNISGQDYRPVDQFSDSFESGQLPDDTYILKPGTRLHLKLKYRVPAEIDSWKLNGNWLLISSDKNYGEWTRLFFEDLKFRQSVLTRQL